MLYCYLYLLYYYLLVFLLSLSVFVICEELSPRQIYNRNADNMINNNVEWLKENFPNPGENRKVCRCSKSALCRICDPDFILSDNEIGSLEELIVQDEIFEIEPSKRQGRCREKGTLTPTEDAASSTLQRIQIQIGIAIMKKMHLSDNDRSQAANQHRGEEEEDLENAAEIFGRYIHDQWGVGLHTFCGDTGIVVFLSVDDRAMYVSRGSGLEDILTDARLDTIIEYTMKPILRQHNYGLAIQQGIEQMYSYVRMGPPNTEERIWHFLSLYWMGILYLLFIVACITHQFVYERKQHYYYAQVATQLSELDYARAQALQGRYRTTSCPICLQNFVVVPSDDDSNNNGDNSDNNNDNATNNNTSSNNDNNDNNTNSNNNNNNNSNKIVGEDNNSRLLQEEKDSAEISTSTRKIMGSDGQPIKLLRCGHIFDETCWAQWVSTGQGDITKCPICQQDVGGNHYNDQQRDSQPDENAVNHDERADMNDNNESSQRQQQQPQQQQRTRIIQQVYRERNFRLARLANRYPQYIRPQQIQRWTQPTYDGSLARDPSFVNSNPRHLRQHQHGRTSHSTSATRTSRTGSSSFGGGSSGGGRGGRW